jgi:hypothetical protein
MHIIMHCMASLEALHQSFSRRLDGANQVRRRNAVDRLCTGCTAWRIFNDILYLHLDGLRTNHPLTTQVHATSSQWLWSPLMQRQQWYVQKVHTDKDTGHLEASYVKGRVAHGLEKPCHPHVYHVLLIVAKGSGGLLGLFLAVLLPLMLVMTRNTMSSLCS